MRLILFDVDGTLLQCGPQMRAILGGALTEVFGTAGRFDGYDFSGKTDQQIVLELMAGAGVTGERVRPLLARLREVYLGRLEERLAREEMCLLPGIEELLGDLQRRADVLLGLVTGNWRDGARIKLSRFGLDRFFDFRVGAYGDDGFERRELPPIALERARQATGRRFGPEDTVIVGDSVRDVDCARSNGLAVMGVSTGWTPAAVLRGAGADRVVESLAGLAGDLAAGRWREAPAAT